MKSIRMIAAIAVLASSGAMAQTANPQIADPSMNGWMGSQKGRITKQQYMDEAGRRWDAMDKNKQGLTNAEINSMYGGAPTPNMVKPSNNRTNPTGTEPKGENSGGK